MFRALFWLTVGFIGGYLFDELFNQPQQDGEIGGSASQPLATKPPAVRTIVAPTATSAAMPVEQAAAPLAEMAKKAEEAMATSAATADDLTQIKGIGPTFARRLVEAGLTTFAQIAAADPDQLRTITKIRDWQRPTAEDWIAEAQTLS